MIRSIQRGWRFYFSELESGCDTRCGLSITPGGGVEMVRGDESIRQSLLMLLSITPGERVMHPDYGCNLHKLVYSVNDETTAGLAIHYVRKAIEKWEPRIHIIRLDARAGKIKPEQLDMIIEYRTINTKQSTSFVYSIDLTGKEL